jgi:peptide/nickel transport system permease protein
MKLFSQEFIQEFSEDRLAVLGFLGLLTFILAALFAGLLAPQNPYDLAELYLENSFKAPFGTFVLGSDSQGRDVFSAILYGLRISIYVAISSTLFSLLVGVFLGLISGYFGGVVDTIIMRIADIQLSFPAILVALVIMSLWGQGITNIIIAITIVSWVFYARTARGVVLAEREKDYVLSARALGMRSWQIMFGEILPNIMAPIIVIGTVRIANTIILEATLSFLGLGVPITEPSLGSLISNGYLVLFSGYWWVSVFPGMVLMLLVIAVNLIGDRLRDVLNPRLKR